jgi:hypothetical protein
MDTIQVLNVQIISEIQGKEFCYLAASASQNIAGGFLSKFFGITSLP